MSRPKEKTSRIMSAIKSENTRPELLLRKEIWRRGLRYKVNEKTIVGKPDIVFTRAKLAVFCDGDFWHGNNWAIRGLNSLEDELRSYSPFWREKILNNIERDKNVNNELIRSGWTVLRFWASDIEKNVQICADIIQTNYKKNLNNVAHDPTTDLKLYCAL